MTTQIQNIFILLLATILLGTLFKSEAGSLDGVRVHDAPGRTRVVLDTSTPVDYKLFKLSNPYRVVIDLEETHPNDALVTEDISSEILGGVRRARRGQEIYRVVLDVSREVTAKSFLLPPIASYGNRLVIDLSWEESTPVPVQRSVDRSKLRDILIAIDPGHGGEDPGAIGVGRVYEKEVVFEISKAIKSELDATRGFKAMLIRTGDYYVPLQKRPNIARERRADLFVSIHADAFKSSRVSGASIYALSEKRATSETTRWLVDNEKRADLIGGVGNSVSLDDQDDVVAEVILDMSIKEQMNDSIAVGDSILGNLGRVAKLHKNTVQQAGFVVLNSPDLPSILIETGFLSNPGEAKLLSSKAHQKKIASAIAEGIRQYVRRDPPPGTLVANLDVSKEATHIVKRGDTLSELAIRYSVSASKIRIANGLENDVIRIGQILVIPGQPT
ncbi:N-acetylmuramoyl-L-alanine amidase [Myxococcota bacterium]|nr:N-acetylmuramoyl-L-alanine amidase [Myxococcota bacterium]